MEGVYKRTAVDLVGILVGDLDAELLFGGKGMLAFILHTRTAARELLRFYVMRDGNFASSGDNRYYIT